MGKDKALLERDGQSQLERSVDLLSCHLDKVFVSAREDQADEPERARFKLILDRYDDMGPVAGILSAMDAYPDAAWLVLACDLPNIGDQTISLLLENYDGSQPFTAYASSHDGLPEPLCAIYAPESRAIVEGFVADGLHCPRKMLIKSDVDLLRQSDPASLDNMNSPEDLDGTGLRFAS